MNLPLRTWTGAPEFDALVAYLRQREAEIENEALAAIKKRDLEKSAGYANKAEGVGEVIRHLEKLFADSREDAR